MADKKLSKTDSDAARAALAKGDPLPAGTCYNPDRYPEEFYPCTEMDERVAKGEVSVSYDEAKVTHLKTGKTVERNEAGKLVESEKSVPATGADTKTTEGAHP